MPFVGFATLTEKDYFTSHEYCWAGINCILSVQLQFHLLLHEDAKYPICIKNFCRKSNCFYHAMTPKQVVSKVKSYLKGKDSTKVVYLSSNAQSMYCSFDSDDF